MEPGVASGGAGDGEDAATGGKRRGRVVFFLAAVVVVAVAIVAFVATGGSAPSGTPAQRLTSWVASTDLGQDIGTMEGDGAHVREAIAEHRGTSTVHTVCAAMANDAQTFNDELPSPDSSVTQLLARAYGLEYDAAEACYRAGATGTALLAQSARDRREAGTLFSEALARVDVVTRRTVPTTTTTAPGTTTTSFL